MDSPLSPTGIARFAKGITAFGTSVGAKYHIFYDASRSCVVSVIDQTALSARAAAKMAKGVAPRTGWLLRIDKAHAGVNSNHINLNPKLTGLAEDPHIRLPPGATVVSKGVAKSLQAINAVALPLAITLDSVALGAAAVIDFQHKTSRNSVSTAAAIAGSWTGGFGGAALGASIGTAMLPGIGTILVGMMGAMSGSVGTSIAAKKMVDGLGDKYNYDIVEKRCERCSKTFKILKYRGENENISFCPECRPKDFTSVSWTADDDVIMFNK